MPQLMAFDGAVLWLKLIITVIVKNFDTGAIGMMHRGSPVELDQDIG